MIRSVLLIFANEFRLLARDRVGVFMLILAPLVIITVAGFSLGNLYGTRPMPRAYLIPVINQDAGTAGAAVVTALRRDRSVAVFMTRDIAVARKLVEQHARAPLAIMIPEGTTARLEAGHPVPLTIYVDPVKRLEVNAIETRLGRLSEQLNELAISSARRQIASELEQTQAELRQQLALLRAQVAAYQHKAAQSREALRRTITQRELSSYQAIQAELDAITDKANSDITKELAERQQGLLALTQYLARLRETAREFDQWIAQLRQLAGKRADAIPPPPEWPPPPNEAAIARLSQPLHFSPPKLSIRENLPENLLDQAIPVPAASPALESLIPNPRPLDLPPLPGPLQWSESSFTGGPTEVSAFDQYVPGFGITFLLIGMLMGLSTGLIDERDGGTLQRLVVSGAPLSAVLIGKLASRFIIGFAQLVVLFAAGAVLFSISLGRNPAALVLPALAIAFAAAAFALIVPCIARTHDSVMPVGAVLSMAMSAIGGCWWPLDFEPSWMRQLAAWLPTSWTMRAFNDLMIRGLPAADVAGPLIATAGLGGLFLIIGLIGTSRLYR